MKFYYNGKLVRTSKTHEYKYGVYSANQDKVIACSATREGAEAHITRIMSDSRDRLKTYEGALKALKAGASGFDSYFGRRSTYIRFRQEHTEKYFTEQIDYYKENLIKIRNNCKIVELEIRA